MVEVDPEVAGRLPRSPRKLSTFFTHEMLYDFMTGALDADRVQGVQEHLKTNEKLKKDLEAMREAEIYLEKLAQTKITQNHLIHLQGYELPAEKMLKKLRFGNWPIFARRLTEALLISVAAAGVGLYIPWGDVRGYLQGLMQANREAGFQANKNTVDTRPDQQTDGLNLNLKMAEIIQKVTVASNESKDSAKKVKPNEVTEKPTDVKAVQGPADVSPVAAGNMAISAEPSVAAKAEATPSTSSQVAPTPTAKKTAGFVYSMMMNLDSTPELTPEITQKIVELGGVKAGQVELGWRKKNPDGSYFHFSMPEGNYDALVKTLGGYGRVRIYKNPHDRVMPEGQIRIILWIEDNLIQQPQADEKQPEQTT